MRVRVTRRGGIAGVPMTAEVDTDELDDPEGARRAVAAAPWGRPAPEPSGADRFTYHLSRPDDGDDARAVLPETDVPPGLRPLVDLARERAVPG